MSSAQALEALRTKHVVDIRVGADIRRGVTAGNHQARQILAALGISDREPPQTQSSEKMPASDKVKMRRLMANEGRASIRILSYAIFCAYL